jgi:hypothetical protein
MEKQLTNSGPLRASTGKHRISTKRRLNGNRVPVRARFGGATVLVVKRSKPFLRANECDGWSWRSSSW